MAVCLFYLIRLLHTSGWCWKRAVHGNLDSILRLLYAISPVLVKAMDRIRDGEQPVLHCRIRVTFVRGMGFNKWHHVVSVDLHTIGLFLTVSH